MEKLMEELILRIEEKRAETFSNIENTDDAYDKMLKSIYTGKIFAFDYCIKELKRTLDYYLAGHIQK